MRSVELVGEIPGWLHYDFPDDVRASFKGGWARFKGQAQKWYLFSFFGADQGGRRRWSRQRPCARWGRRGPPHGPRLPHITATDCPTRAPAPHRPRPAPAPRPTDQPRRAAEINLATSHREFSAWRWAELGELPGKVIPFKRGVYETVAEHFGRRIEQLRAEGQL